MGADVDAPATRGRCLTPLHAAAEHGHAAMTALLLSRGASVHARSATETTPFYRAARGGSVEVLRQLRAAAAAAGSEVEVDARTWDGWTPLMEAAENGHREAAALLLAWGADPASRSRYGTTPLSLAGEYLAPCIVRAGAERGLTVEDLRGDEDLDVEGVVEEDFEEDQGG